MRDLLRTRKQLVRAGPPVASRRSKKPTSQLGVTDSWASTAAPSSDALVKGERDPAGLQTLVSAGEAAPERSVPR